MQELLFIPFLYYIIISTSWHVFLTQGPVLLSISIVEFLALLLQH